MEGKLKELNGFKKLKSYIMEVIKN